MSLETPNRIRTLQRKLYGKAKDEPDYRFYLLYDKMYREDTFRDGFRVRLKLGMSDVRARFTLAHEACHTFFYQLVPEIKFFPHDRDSEKERLCNFGAAGFLVPASPLRRQVRTLPRCLESLELLASNYGVSPLTMALRLRGLGYWQCQLHRHAFT